MRSMRKRLIDASAISIILFATASGEAFSQKKYDPGVTDNEIRIGNIMPYSGPASAYGVIGKTEAAYFNRVNREGGINGRKINFISYDDAYSPPKTVEHARKLVESDEVFVVFNPLGTPSNTAIQKYLNAKKVPQLFVASGATKWDDPKNFPWTMGWQPSYQSEARIYAKLLMKEKPDAKIAIMFQNDDFGKDYLKGLKDGLGAQASRIVAEESYGWKPLHILTNVSASVASVMKPAGFENSQGIISAAYLKDVADSQWDDDPGMKDFYAFMAKDFPKGDNRDSLTVVGYGVAQTLVQVLRQCGDELTRENVMKQAANLIKFRTEVLLPGISINTDPNDYAPINQLQLMKFKGEKWELFGEVTSSDVGG